MSKSQNGGPAPTPLATLMADTGAVAELVGLHGAFTFPERLMQRIWWRGDFDASALRLRDGRPLRVLKRGRWNHLGGPDFADAEVAVGEGAAREVWRGAIEVHLHASDWDQHGHAADPAYEAVVLHVVLFPSMREWTRGAGGRKIPILELLPLLEQDLEAYAQDAAIEEIAGRPYSQLREAFATIPIGELRGEVQRHTERRWAAKVRLAGRRIARLGWEAACHHSALEVLGYRPNRVPMLAVAEALPLGDWRNVTAATRAQWVETALGVVEPTAWVRGGVRPANQPRRRLAQYSEWVNARPDWPHALAHLGRGMDGGPPFDAIEGRAALPGVVVNAPSLRARRRGAGLPALRERLVEEVCGGVLGGTRFDTMVCDAWLPLLAAQTDGEARAAKFAHWWKIWTPGDAPAELIRLVRESQVSGEVNEPLGQGDLQGLLGWLSTLVPRESG